MLRSGRCKISLLTKIAPFVLHGVCRVRPVKEVQIIGLVIHIHTQFSISSLPFPTFGDLFAPPYVLFGCASELRARHEDTVIEQVMTLIPMFRNLNLSRGQALGHKAFDIPMLAVVQIKSYTNIAL